MILRIALATAVLLAPGLVVFQTGAAGTACASEQTYVVDFTVYAFVESVKSLLDGEPLADGFAATRGLSGIDILKLLHEHDVEYSLRWRPAWRADGDRTKRARGFAVVRIYLWETIGPVRHLDYEVKLIANTGRGGGASTVVKSRFDFDLRRFSWRGEDRLIFMLANVPFIHRFINRTVETAVHGAEWGLLNGYAAADKARRDRERAERRAKP